MGHGAKSTRRTILVGASHPPACPAMGHGAAAWAPSCPYVCYCPLFANYALPPLSLHSVVDCNVESDPPPRPLAHSHDAKSSRRRLRVPSRALIRLMYTLT